MTISWPDPDIGRCKSYRSQSYSDGHYENVRCLDYEDHEGRCSFPEFTHVVAPASGAFSTYTFTPPQPKPWVRPDNIGEEGVRSE